jgi:hypothetical protein
MSWVREDFDFKARAMAAAAPFPMLFTFWGKHVPTRKGREREEEG